MSFIKETESYLKDVLKKCGYETEDITLESSSRRDLGEFQINIAMSLAKKYGENPRDIAGKIVDNLDERFTNVNIAGPGFINVSISEDYLLKYMNKSINNFDNLIDKQKEKTIIVDYGGANAAKALHIGHMRPANIGESLKRLSSKLGNKTIGDVHLGDIGRQSGMIISELKRRKPDLCFFNPYRIRKCPEELVFRFGSVNRAGSEELCFGHAEKLFYRRIELHIYFGAHKARLGYGKLRGVLFLEKLCLMAVNNRIIIEYFKFEARQQIGGGAFAREKGNQLSGIAEARFIHREINH